MSPLKKKTHILIVDDKKNMLRLLSKVLQADGVVTTVDCGAKAIALLEKEKFHVVLSDLRMPDIDGIEVLKKCRELQPQAEFILMTAYASISTAIEAMRLGAYDYISKPFEPEYARSVVLRAIGRAMAESTDQQFSGTAAEVLPGVIAKSRIMRELGQMVVRFAESDATTLILGETGTGKERIARALYLLSRRSSRRFVSVNCAAIPPDLVESELFGFTKGSFTGATGNREGLFEAANNGVLFLDEIGEMRFSMQAKLTRAIEERAIRRIGDYTERPVDVRIIAATHRNLEKMVADETFREDLWYRLNVAVINIPPLRERIEDIELLAIHFLKDFSSGVRSGRKSGFSDEALEVMRNYDWPGNVRQLRAVVERSSIFSTGEVIGIEDLPPELIGSPSKTNISRDLSGFSWAEAMEIGRREIAISYLEQILKKHSGQVSEAAEHAGVERESFYRLMRKFDIKS